MTSLLAPALFALFLWWFSTGAILWLDGLPQRTFRWSLLGATVVAIAAAFGVAYSADHTSATGAYLGFSSALGLWGWLEMTFLMGFITGPRRSPCPPGARGWQRFRLAAATLLYHELAIVAMAAGIVALSWDAPNQTATATFAVLMGMRLSTKLNIFLGVANITEAFLPDHLDYLKSYFRKRGFNPLFPASLIGSVALALALGWYALQAPDGSGAAVSGALLFTLVCLAILEHGFLMLPLGDIALWRWALHGKADAHPRPSPRTTPRTGTGRCPLAIPVTPPPLPAAPHHDR